MSAITDPLLKNQDGHLGPICNYCGGYGYTNLMQSQSSAGCPKCGGTGIEPPNIYQLGKDVELLKATCAEILSLLKGRNS